MQRCRSRLIRTRICNCHPALGRPIVKLPVSQLTTDGRQLLNAGKIPLISPEVLREIISTASDIALFVAPDLRVVSVLVNPTHRSYGQLVEWEGSPISALLTSESLIKFEMRARELTERQRVNVQVELNHVDKSRWEFPVRYALHLMESDGSILMLGRDLRPIAEVQQQLVTAQLALERDYEAQREMDTRYRVLMEVSRDPLLMVSMSTGRISDLNPAAALMMGGSKAELIGSAIAQEFEGRRRGELLDTMSNLAGSENTGPIEVTAHRSQRRLLLSPTVFRARVSGFCCVSLMQRKRRARPVMIWLKTWRGFTMKALMGSSLPMLRALCVPQTRRS